MNFDKESISEKKKNAVGVGRGGGGGQGGGNTETKTVCQTVKEVKFKTATIYTCKACGTINITKYVSNF